MKGSWYLYDYLRRWWWLLLLGLTLGGMVGLIYFNSQQHAIEYSATATLIIEDPGAPRHNPPPILLTTETGGKSAAEEAIDSAVYIIRRLGTHADTPVIVPDLVIDRTMSREAWWKAAVLGSVVGFLLAIGAIYVWEDASAYQRHRRQSL